MTDAGVSFALSAARSVYLMMTQLKLNREEVSSLALRVNLLIGCLTTSNDIRRGKGSDILNQVNEAIEKIRSLVTEFSYASTQRQFFWSNEYAKRCNDLNMELTHYVQVRENEASGCHRSHNLAHAAVSFFMSFP